MKSTIHILPGILSEKLDIEESIGGIYPWGSGWVCRPGLRRRDHSIVGNVVDSQKSCLGTCIGLHDLQWISSLIEF
jgi:hypothetical protein